MIHDATKTIGEGIPVWPGDVEFSMRTVQNAGFRSSSVTMSLHTGTHMDAPRHRFQEGRSIDSYAPFIVPALFQCAGSVKGKAVLFKGPLTEAEARSLVEGGAVLAGTASISIDHPDTTVAHEMILGAGIPVIENLVLDGLEPGEYVMLAFPLKFRGADGSPVRVILADSLEDILPGVR